MNIAPLIMWQGIFELIIFSVIGLVFGSFSTALIHRVPRGLSWGRSLSPEGRSACPNCEEPLKVKDLFPLLSWLIQKGRCRYCCVPITKTYLMAELLCLFMALSCYGVYGFTAQAFIISAAIPFLAALLFIDLKHTILPNILVLLLGVIGVLFHAFHLYIGALRAIGFGYYMLSGIIYAALIFVVGWITGKVLKKEALGMGDVKFFAVAGLWLGLEALPAFCILSGLIGVMWGIAWKYRFKSSHFPFGPALIASFFILTLFFDKIYLLFNKFG